MPSQEAHLERVYKVNTPRMGVDGLREALVALYGARTGQRDEALSDTGSHLLDGGDSSENTRERVMGEG